MATTAKRGDAGGKARALLAVTLIAPVLVLVAAAGTRFGAWDWRLGFEIMTLTGAWYLAWIGAAAALLSVFLAFGDARRSGPPALLAVLIAGTVLGLFGRYFFYVGPDAPSPDATTDRADPPGFAAQIMARRAEAGAVSPNRWADDPATCKVAAAPGQVAPEVAAYALQQAGFTVLGAGVGRADGTHEGFWFGFTQDATIRIRPGRTDIRVAAREDRPDGGAACRLAQKIAAALEP